MTARRPALRLHEKVAAENRRLEGLGGRRSRWALPLAALVAVAVHAGALLAHLPDQPERDDGRSPRPDLPPVWRWGPPLERDVAAEAAPPPAAVRAPARVAPIAARHDEDVDLEPVPEPPIDLAGSIPPAQIDRLIPMPDAVPPSRGRGEPLPGGPGGAAPIDLTPVSKSPPVFPSLARTIRAEGRVSLIATVGADGEVLAARVVECTRPGVGFEQSALAAVKHWRYAPVPPGRPDRAVAVHIDFRTSEPER